MNVGEVLRLTLSYTYPNASEAMNVFYYELTGGNEDDSQVETDIVDWVVNTWVPVWEQIASAGVFLTTAALDIMNTDGTVARNLTTEPIGLAGQVPQHILPAANAYYLQAYTSMPKQRGSKYVPGIPETLVDDGKITAPTVVFMLGLLTAYLAPVAAGTSGSLVPGILSKTLLQFVPFLISGVVTDIPAYQRRRKPNVGS